MNNKIRIVAGLGLAVLAYTVSSSANDAFLQWQQQQFNGVQAQKDEFQDYKDKRDKEFTSFLREQWKAVDLLKGNVRDEAPKPDVMPVAPPDSTEIKAPVSKPVARVVKPIIDTPVDRLEPELKPVTATGDKVVSVDFYGKRISFNYDGELKQRLSRRIDKVVISDYWSTLSRTEYEGLLQQLDAQKTHLQLNDWAYASLINKVALKLNVGRPDETVLFSWFLLAKSGYKARVAYDDLSIYLLVPSQHEMFEVSYFKFGEERYYAVAFEGGRHSLGRVYTYDGEYPDATKEFNMHVTSTVVSGNQSERRQLSFNFEGQQYDIEVVYDQGRIDFFRTYPQLALNLYFDSGVDKITATPLEKQLAEHISDMSEERAVNFLLRFVQTSLTYATDEQQFGEENYLFPEETLFYPYSDCEDRAVLFSWLAKRLLKLEVIGLDYPGHVATAVHFNGSVKGDSVTYEGKRFVVADPTYINAKAGMSMPKFKQFKAKVIAY